MPTLKESRTSSIRRHAVRWRGLSLGWPYCIIVVSLAANWIWDIFDRLIK